MIPGNDLKTFQKSNLVERFEQGCRRLEALSRRDREKEAVGFGARNRQLFGLQHVAPELVSRGEIAASGQSYEEQ